MGVGRRQTHHQRLRHPTHPDRERPFATPPDSNPTRRPLKHQARPAEQQQRWRRQVGPKPLNAKLDQGQEPPRHPLPPPPQPPAPAKPAVAVANVESNHHRWRRRPRPTSSPPPIRWSARQQPTQPPPPPEAPGGQKLGVANLPTLSHPGLRVATGMTAPAGGARGGGGEHCQMAGHRGDVQGRPTRYTMRTMAGPRSGVQPTNNSVAGTPTPWTSVQAEKNAALQSASGQAEPLHR